MIISNKDKILISELIKEAESKTQSEIVPMVVHHSDIYPVAHFRSAIIVSFLFSLALYYSPLRVINPIYFLWIQIPGLFFGYYLGRFPLIKRFLITRSEIEKEVIQRGYEAFFNHNLHLTDHHTGVLILVSLMERKIKIITDTGIAKKVDQKIWDEMVFQFAKKIQNDQFIEGFKECIEAVSSVLQTYFPVADTQKTNELKDELIIE